MASSTISNNKIRSRDFNVKINQSFAAGASYTFSRSDFGMGDITPLGFAMATIYGNYNRDNGGSLAYTNNDQIVYNSTVANSEYCTFKGVVFY